MKSDGINKNIGVQDVSGVPSGVYFLAPGNLTDCIIKPNLRCHLFCLPTISQNNHNNQTFLLIDKFLGDQKASYGQTLRFKLRLGESGAIPRPDDLIIMSGGNRPIKISVSLTDQDNPVPSLSVNIKGALIY